MLYLKLTTPVSKVYQEGFTQTTVSGSYLVAQATNYDLGATTSSFYTKVGKMEFDETGSATSFKSIISDNIQLTSDELANWGTDDFEVLKVIASKLNFSIESSGSTDLTFTY